jgi:hypothetical protein
MSNTERPFGVLTLGLLAVLMIHAAGRPVAAQDTATHVLHTAAFAGVVRDSLGHPIMLATISTDSEARRATSDSAGQFAIRGLPPGHVGVHVQRIGYEPMAFVLDLSVDSTVHVEIRLHGNPVLQAVLVQGAAPSARFAQTGFFDRQRMTSGQFLTPAQVDSSIANTPSELLRAFHGVDVICGSAETTDPSKSMQAVLPPSPSSKNRGSSPHAVPPTTGGTPTTGGVCKVKSRGAGCLWLFVDGKFVDAQLDEVTSRAEVVAVEFYERNGEVPAELQGPMRGSSCGALAVWTKTYSP